MLYSIHYKIQVNIFGNNPCICRYTDFVNVMAYDLHGDWDNYTGSPGQLYPREEEYGPSTQLNVVRQCLYTCYNCQSTMASIQTEKPAHGLPIYCIYLSWLP